MSKAGMRLVGLVFGFALGGAIAGAGIGHLAGTGHFLWASEGNANQLQLHIAMVLTAALAAGLVAYAFLGWRHEERLNRQRCECLAEIKTLIEQERESFATATQQWQQKDRAWREAEATWKADEAQWFKEREEWQGERANLAAETARLKDAVAQQAAKQETAAEHIQKYKNLEDLLRKAEAAWDAEREELKRACAERQSIIEVLTPKVSALEAETGKAQGPGAASERELAEARRRCADYEATIASLRANLGALTAEKNARGADTERAARERELKETVEQLSEKLREASRDRVDFLAKVSGTLHAPVARMAQIVRTAREGATELPLAEVAQLAETFLRKLGDVLDLAKLQAGAYPLVTSEVSLERALAPIVADFRPRAEARDITLVWNQADQDLGRVSLDERILSRCVAHLLSNAIRFTPRAGRVELKGAVIPHGKKRRVVVEVRDTGIGIAPQNQEIIFQPFVHSIQPRSEIAEEGIGIGLSLVRACVELHGGEISTSSTPGEGSVFRLCLDERTPAADTAPQRDPELTTAFTLPR
jgi:signal transduction histidine kinase